MKHENYEISHLFPNVKEIHIVIADTNAWPCDRLRDFSLETGSQCNFHIDCPMSKCLGEDGGIYYKQPISDMVNNGDNHKQVRLSCVGYGGYNLTFHCDWYVVLDISITYRTR